MINRKQGTIELVDIEELYGPNQPHPVELPAGQDGYQHRQGRSEGQWHANGDRFAGAVIIAEMLGWADARVRQYSADEHYFSAAEMQDPDSARLKILLESLRDQHGAELATLFDQAWRSQTLAECPPLSAWQAALSTIKTETLDAQPVVTNPVVVVGRRAVAPGAAPAPIPLPTNNPIPAGRLQLEGIKLCRNCGAENPQSFTFCKRCGYFIGTSAQKRATTAKSAAKDAAAPAPSAASVKTASPQAVSLQRDNQEIVSAKRVGAGSGQGMRRIVYKEQPPTDNTSNASQPPTDTTGGLIIAGIIMLMIVAVLVLLLMAR
jgi:pyruvate/2-oxoglutarate dehydrogenase complex dihydrolipoamide acyltransferase (E2) component